MRQHEITRARPLLDSRGNIAEPGYAKRLLPVYRRADVKAPAYRIKEWDYYLVNNGRYALALTVADNGYMGMDSISFLDFENHWQQTLSPMCAFPMGRRKLPESSQTGDVAVSGKGYELAFRHTSEGRLLLFKMENFASGRPIEGRVLLTEEPEESMVICTPFHKRGHFYFNQKINCLRASGWVSVRGQRREFEPETAFAVLDWGRGVCTYHNTWYWGSASGLAEGETFGWNIGYGFGDTSVATENMLFFAGKAHKLGRVTFNIPRRGGELDYMSPWTFSSDDSRFEMDFRPVLDRAACTDFRLLKSDQHQVFGRFTGTAVLDGGRRIRVKDFPGFAERVENKW